MSENNENLELNEAVENNAAEVEATPVVETQKVASAVAEEEFDWDAFEGKKATGASVSKEQMTDLYNNTFSILQEKECVDGTVFQ